MSDNRRLRRVFADPPTVSEILGHPIDGNGSHPVWRAIGIAALVAAGATAIGTVAFIAFAFGIL